MGKTANTILKIASPAYGIYSGARDQRKAEKGARREARAEAAQQAEQQNLIRAENARTQAQIAGLKANVNAGVARSNKRRIRGGIFGGDTGGVQQQGLLNPRLG